MSRDDEYPAARAALYEHVQSMPEFSRLRRRRRTFVASISVAFLAWYVTYVLVAAYFPSFMSFKLSGNINVALIMGFLQVFSSLLITIWYVQYTTRNLDPDAALVRAFVEEEKGRHPRRAEPDVPVRESSKTDTHPTTSGGGR